MVSRDTNTPESEQFATVDTWPNPALKSRLFALTAEAEAGADEINDPKVTQAYTPFQKNKMIVPI
jgi:hypothetical protein